MKTQPDRKPRSPVDPAALEWDGRRLYVHRAGQRVYVGEVVEQAFSGGCFDVLVRGSRKHTLNSEASARRQLEAYA